MTPLRSARARFRPPRLAALALIVVAGVGTGMPAAADDDRVRLTTSLGDIVVEVFPEQAPQTASNFLRLVDKGFYEGLVFHRVVPGFVVQAGGYDARMSYREPPGNVPNESANGLSNETGTIAMARLSDPDSANTQFYINLGDNTNLDARPGRPGYTVFGRVVEGMDVVRQIESVATTSKAAMTDVPVEPVVIERARRL